MSELLSVKPMGLVWGGVGVSLLVLIQVMLGTQVRENVDLVSSALGEANRHEWIPNLGDSYRLHRSFYYLVTVSIMYWVWLLKGRFFSLKSVKILSIALLAILITEIIFGLSMHSFNIPPFLQPLHLLLGTLLFATAYTITGILYLKKN